jgi:two-component system cell cycle sensor histidine kinase/response regulator CckA
MIHGIIKPNSQNTPARLNEKRAYPVRYGVMAFLLVIFATTLGVLSFGGYWESYLSWFIKILAFVLLFCGVGLAWVTSILIHRQYRDRSILSEIFDGSPSARLVTDIQDRALFYNPAFEDFCQEGEKPSLDIIRRIFGCRNDENTLQRLEGIINNARRGHEDNMEAEVKDGIETRWYRLSAQPVAGWLGTIHWRIDNITDRRAIEAVIREEREKLVDFTDNAPVGFYAVDEQGRFTFVNATLARWLGSDIDSLLKHGFLHSYMENPPQDAKPYDVVENGGAKQVAELTMKGPAGKIFKVSVSQSVVHETADKVSVRGVVHDLTNEREMRQALRDSEDRFTRFFHEAPLGIVMIDQDQKITDSNILFSEMVGEPSKDIEGKGFIDFVFEQDRHRVEEKIKALLGNTKTVEPIDIELVSAADDDGKVAVQMHASRFKGDYIAIRLFDRREQKILEEQFTQSQKMQAVGQLAGGVAHDFNNLLTAMIGFCDLLLLRHKAGDPSFNDIMQIKQNSNRAANLVRQLLAFSRQQQLNPKVLDITETLTELSHLIRRLIGVQIDLEMIHSPVLDSVKVDEGQLEQVLINLVVNARDAMDGKGRLEIETENLTTLKPVNAGSEQIPPGHWVVIHVRDTGSGIDDKTMARIFEPFFTTKDIGAGTGLGLATVYGIIRQTGGYIKVESEVGKGTTFSLYFPKFVRSDSDIIVQDKNEEKRNQEDLTGTATILLVEDEDAVRMFSARALSNKGYQVLEATNGEAALEVMENHDGVIDIMVTDVIMPEMDGPTLAKQVIKKYPDMPIIFVSGYTEDRFKEEIGENAHFLPKPFTLQQLAEKVKETLSL